MQSLSWNAQVQSLASSILRCQAEVAEQSRIAATVRRPTKKKRRFLYDAILAAMQPNRAYGWAELESASGLPPAKFKSALTTAVTNGRIDKTPDRDGNVYSLPLERNRHER